MRRGLKVSTGVPGRLFLAVDRTDSPFVAEERGREAGALEFVRCHKMIHHLLPLCCTLQ